MALPFSDSRIDCLLIQPDRPDLAGQFRLKPTEANEAESPDDGPAPCEFLPLRQDAHRRLWHVPVLHVHTGRAGRRERRRGGRRAESDQCELERESMRALLLS
jgi:hypothetical protein